jgi:hypothetical protein
MKRFTGNLYDFAVSGQIELVSDQGLSFHRGDFEAPRELLENLRDGYLYTLDVDGQESIEVRIEPDSLSREGAKISAKFVSPGR